MRQQAGQRQRGFTIMEIIVVVAVISLIASAILLNTNFNRPADRLETHVEKLAKTLTLLLQEAILNDANYAISLLPNGYTVLQFNGETWSEPEDRFILSLKVTGSDYRDELTINQRLVVPVKADELQPHILLLASGETTPFEWVLRDEKNRLGSKITSDILG